VTFNSENMAGILVDKILAALAIVLLSLVFGFLPLLLAKKYELSTGDSQDPIIAKKERKKLKNVILSFLLNLGGGVLLANCFCHWLPEVREGLDHTDIDSILPLAEVIMCSGFFFICGLEEVIHHFLAPHQHQQIEKKKEKKKKVHPQSSDLGPGNEPAECWTEDEEDEKTAANITAALRTTFVLLALSFHSVVEGLALSLEQERPGVWLNTGATALHKFVIAFSLGVELVSNKASKLQFIISIVVFSLAPALGCLCGILIEETSGDNAVNDLPVQILQGIATGTIVYVIFFEIFPKAKEVGGTGFQHVSAMVLGFCIFLPSLLLHGSHDHEEGHEKEALFVNSSSLMETHNH